MNFGILSCPHCHEKKMYNFDHWETRTLENGQKQWLFYNKINKKRGWQCWALLKSCNKRYATKWYDPCNCCFNPCSVDKNRKITYRYYADGHVEKDDDRCIICCGKWIGLFLLYGVIFEFYFLFFIWYDIYYCFFKKQKGYDVYVAGEDKPIFNTEKEGLWYQMPNEALTEEFYKEYSSNIFKCKKCLYTGQSFTDFIGNEDTVVDVNNTADNTGTNMNNTTSNGLNLQGDDIQVHIVSADKSINQFFPSHTKDLFSNIIERFFGVYTQLRNKQCIFTCNGKHMNPNLTLEQNKYKSGSTILVTAS